MKNFKEYLIEKLLEAKIDPFDFAHNHHFTIDIDDIPEAKKKREELDIFFKENFNEKRNEWKGEGTCNHYYNAYDIIIDIVNRVNCEKLNIPLYRKVFEEQDRDWSITKAVFYFIDEDVYFEIDVSFYHYHYGMFDGDSKSISYREFYNLYLNQVQPKEKIEIVYERV